MNLNVIKQSFVNVGIVAGRFFKSHAPEILAGAGIGFGIASTISAVAVTPEAAKKIEAKKEELGVDKLTPVQTVKEVGKLYLPAVIEGTLAAGLVVASVTEGKKQIISLATSYGLLKDSSEAYKNKVAELFGEKKEDKVQDAIAQERVDNNPPTDGTIISTNKGGTLFMDSLSGQYFRHDIDEVKRKAIELANLELNDGYVGVYEWFRMIGLNVTDYWGDQGWSQSDQGKVVTIELRAVTAHNYNDEPCLVIDYSVNPINGYYTYYK